MAFLLPNPRGQKVPVTSLPPELLSSIFQDILPEVMDAVGRKQFQHLRMTCSLWRRLCFATPHLWTSLTLYAVGPIDEQEGVVAQSYAQLLEGWFRRSGSNTALNLAIEHCENVSGEEIEGITQVVHSLQSRWRYLSLNVERRNFWELIRLCPRDGWSNLHHIAVTDDLLDTWMDELSPVPEGRVEDRFPLAKTLELTTRWSDSFLFYSAATTSVETLVWHAEEFPARMFMDVLSPYIHLTTLELRCGSLGWEAAVVAPPLITLGSLRSFTFAAEISYRTMTLIERFQLPFLNHLKLELEQAFNDEEPDDEDDEESIVDIERILEAEEILTWGGQTITSFFRPILESCNKTLVDFSLTGNAGRDYARSILSALPPSTSTLHLQSWPYVTSFVDAPPLFNPPSSTSPSEIWLPRLKGMRLYEVPSPKIPREIAQESLESLLAFSRGRVQPEASWSRLASLGVTRGTEHFTDTILREFQEKRINVTAWAKGHTIEDGFGA
jgi:F-box-like